MQDEVGDFFDELDMQAPKPLHIAIMPCVRRPWIRKYAWFAAGAPPVEPSANPSVAHSLWIAVRNLSVGTYKVSFECESQNGRLRFDKSDPPGYRFAVDLAAPPATRDGNTKPNFKSTAVAVDRNSEVVEVISVKARAFNGDLQIGDEESDEIILRFG